MIDRDTTDHLSKKNEIHKHTVQSAFNVSRKKMNDLAKKVSEVQHETTHSKQQKKENCPKMKQ